MIDINLIRTNPEVVKENIKKKFQDNKLEYVDKVLELDKQCRAYKAEGDEEYLSVTTSAPTAELTDLTSHTYYDVYLDNELIYKLDNSNKYISGNCGIYNYHVSAIFRKFYLNKIYKID